MEAGATDYLVKSELATDKLERSIRYAIDRSNSLKSLRESEKKYRAIFEKSKDAVFIADEKFYFKEVNPALNDLLGYGSKQMARLSIFDLIADESKKILITRLLSEHGEVHDLTLELAAKGGDKIHCLLSASMLTDGRAEPYIQGIIHDITDLKKAERSHLQSEKLKSANRLLRILAHEVRNPLTNINIAMDMMESEFSIEGAQQYLDIVRRSSRRINELVSELLDSSRQKELTFENITLRQIIEQTLEMASDRIALKNIQVLATFPKEDSIVKVDPVKIKIALLNIIINAIEAISHEQGKLQVRVEQSKNGYDIYIEDNGCGISEKNMSRLFEPFFTSKKNGLGLGLASSLAILQSHEMNVDVKSRPGKGTSFVINVPNKEPA
jgi:PAS domain S-box-containing protein